MSEAPVRLESVSHAKTFDSHTLHNQLSCVSARGDLYIHCLRTPRSHICIQGSVTVGPCVLSCMADLELVVLKDSLAIGSHDLSDASSLYLHPCPAATS